MKILRYTITVIVWGICGLLTLAFLGLMSRAACETFLIGWHFAGQ